MSRFPNRERQAATGIKITLLSRLVTPVGKLFLFWFPNRERQARTKGVPFCPGSGKRDKKHPFVPVGNTNRDKRGCQRHVPGAPFCPGWCYQPEQKVHFFLFLFSQFFFYFNYTFTFQLNLCIGIQCVRSPLIYTYIYRYLYNICPR